MRIATSNKLHMMSQCTSHGIWETQFMYTKGLLSISSIPDKCSYLCISSHGFQCYLLELSPWQQEKNEEVSQMDLYCNKVSSCPGSLSCISKHSLLQIKNKQTNNTTANQKNPNQTKQPTTKNLLPLCSNTKLILRHIIPYLKKKGTEGEAGSASSC